VPEFDKDQEEAFKREGLEEEEKAKRRKERKEQNFLDLKLKF